MTLEQLTTRLNAYDNVMLYILDANIGGYTRGHKYSPQDFNTMLKLYGEYTVDNIYISSVETFRIYIRPNDKPVSEEIIEKLYKILDEAIKALYE